MKTLLSLALASLLLAPLSAQAKGWYDVCKTNNDGLQVKDKKNFYVGGSANNNHLHVGSNFIAITSTNNNSKPVTSGKANCALIKAAITDAPGGGYASLAHVQACLNAVCADEGCGCTAATKAPETKKSNKLEANPNKPAETKKKTK
jgi:hypothetical protein